MEMENQNNKYKTSLDFLTCKPYTPPSWATNLYPIPSHRFSLAHLPTPIHRWKLPRLPRGTKVWLKALTNMLKEKLVKEGRKPYVIPPGGSNPIGIWGYIEAIREIEQQVEASSGALKFDDIVVACGSGGTVAGLSLGSWLGNLKAKVHAFSVCGYPDYFHSVVQDLTDGLAARVDSHIVNIQNTKGLGYSMNTSCELQFLKEVAVSTGVVLDPVYSGKAAYGMLKDMAENPKKWEGRKILFIHTGGILGLHDKVEQLSPLVGNWARMDVDESILRNHSIATGDVF